MGEFNKKWTDTVRDKKSMVVAGADPKPGTPNLPEWAAGFVREIGSRVAGIKPNLAFYPGEEGSEALEVITDFAKDNGIVTIRDNKAADIGSTNDAWAESAVKQGFDAMTIAPYAGNGPEAIKSLKSKGLGAITMGIMSNPEFGNEARFSKIDPQLWKEAVDRLVEERGLEGALSILRENPNFVDGIAVELWEDRANKALEVGVDTFVLGATKTEDPLFKRFLGVTKEHDVTYLVPGLGAQGGDINTFLDAMREHGVDPRRVMLNFGRSMMYPKSGTRGEEAQRLQEICQEHLR